MKREASHLVVLFACAVLLSSACLSSAPAPGSEQLNTTPADTDSDSSDTESGALAPLAELLGFEQSATGVRIRVISNGCTRAEDFKPVVNRLDAGRVQLSVLRNKPDNCRRMPAAKTVEFSREVLGLENEEVILMNPLVELPGRG